MEEVCAADRVLMEKDELKRQCEKPWLRWVDNIKMNSREMRWGCGLSYLAHDTNEWRLL
jgi:hypothetical protein